MSVAVAIACPDGVVIACDSAAGDDGQVTNLARIKFARSSNGAFIAAWTGALCYQNGTVQVADVVRRALNQCEADNDKKPNATANYVGSTLAKHQTTEEEETYLLLGGRDGSKNPELWYVAVIGMQLTALQQRGDSVNPNSTEIGDVCPGSPGENSLVNGYGWRSLNPGPGALALMDASRVCREAVNHVINDPKVPSVGGMCTTLCVTKK